jgi:penicillin G amidase
MTAAAELGTHERAVLRRLLRAEVTLAEAARQEGVGRREIVRWRRSWLAEKLPPRAATVLAAVDGPTTIRRDAWGVPHVSADSLADLCLGLGYAMAQERLWLLDWYRRQAWGTLAEVLGSAALAGDREARILGLGRAALQAEDHLTADERTMLAGITAGINAWLEQAGDTLPLEFDALDYRPAPWRVVDCLAIWKLRQWDSTGRLQNVAAAEAIRRNLTSDFIALFLATEEGQETIYPSEPDAAAPAPGGDAGGGSNNWAVTAERTTTGAPALAGDPHHPFRQAWLYFECHLRGAGLNVAGATILGLPCFFYGRNERLAWSVTNHSVSTRDLYIEETESGEPNRYREEGVWRSFVVEEEEIQVRDAPTEYVSIKRSVRGPIVTSIVPELEYWSGPPLSLRWVGYEPETGLGAILNLARANTVAEGRAAMRDWRLPVLNLALADTEGTIAMQTAGRVPKRGEARPGYRKPTEAVDGWLGHYAVDEMPAEVQPARGWVASANNAPWPAESDWTKLGAWADGYRMRRIRHRIEARARHTPEELGAIQADIVHGRALDLAGRLAWWLEETGEPTLEDLARHLHAWDGRYAPDLIAPTIFETLWGAWLERVTDGRMPTRLIELTQPRAGALARALLLGEESGWFHARTVREQLRAAAREAVKRLESAAGADSAGWTWGRLHRATFAHPLGDRPGLRRLSIGPYPTSGGSSTVRAAGHGDRPPFAAVGGAVYRLVADLSRADQCWSVVPTGQSGHPASPHYRDQTPLWLADRYKPLWLSDALIDANLEGVTTLNPAAAGASDQQVSST